MKKITLIMAFLMLLLGANPAFSQRRKRPDYMKHTEADAQNVTKITAVKALHIKDNTIFGGDVYMVGDAGGIKIGNAQIAFRNGHYTFTYTSKEFEMREASTRDERLQKGITEYEYENSWKNEKLGSDFGHKGKYAVQEQYGTLNLILYDGDTKNVFAKIPLSSPNTDSFEFQEGDMLMQMCRMK